MTIIGNVVVNAAASRLALDARSERDLIEIALRRLPEVVYRRLHTQGFVPGGIVDIGAHEGDSTRIIRAIFPAPPILMIEARKEQAPALQKVCSECPGVNYTISLFRTRAEYVGTFSR